MSGTINTITDAFKVGVGTGVGAGALQQAIQASSEWLGHSVVLGSTFAVPVLAGLVGLTNHVAKQALNTLAEKSKIKENLPGFLNNSFTAEVFNTALLGGISFLAFSLAPASAGLTAAVGVNIFFLSYIGGRIAESLPTPSVSNAPQGSGAANTGSAVPEAQEG